MKLKTRLLMPLFVVLMLGMATSAFAQLNCNVAATLNTVVPGPVPRETVNSHWANTGDLTFTCTGGPASTTEASITIFYGGLTITNSRTLPTDHFIEIAPGASYGVVIDTTRTDTGITGVSNTGSLIALTIPAQVGPTANGAFTLRNVVLSLAGGVTSGSSVSANLNVVSAGGNVVLAGQPVVIITAATGFLSGASGNNPPALQPPIAGEPAAPAQFTSTGANPPASVSCSTANCLNSRASFVVTFAEDHIDSFRTPSTYYNNLIGQSINSTNVLFTFSGMLPGSIMSNCVVLPPPGTFWNLTGSGIASSAGTTTLVAEMTPGSAPNLTAIETLGLRCGTSTVNPAYLVGGSTGAASTPITVTAQAFPTGSALANVAGQLIPSLAGGTPRYQAGSTVGPLTVVQFGGNAVGQTTLLIPYALSLGSFDTGIAIANTTKDPMFGTDVQGAAVDTSGSLTLNFFPGDGSPNFSITPASGFNLVNGAVPSGNSFIGTLSSILRSANITTPFQGYIIAVTNFTHAHGAAYVYGGTTGGDRITSATDVLIMSNPLSNSRNTLGILPAAELTTK